MQCLQYCAKSFLPGFDYGHWETKSQVLISVLPIVGIFATFYNADKAIKSLCPSNATELIPIRSKLPSKDEQLPSHVGNDSDEDEPPAEVEDERFNRAVVFEKVKRNAVYNIISNAVGAVLLVAAVACGILSVKAAAVCGTLFLFSFTFCCILLKNENALNFVIEKRANVHPKV